MAQRKAKYKAKLAQRIAQEAAASAGDTSEKSRAGGMLNAPATSEPAANDGGSSATQPSPLVARMQQRRQRSNARGAHKSPAREGKPTPRQPAQRAADLTKDTSLDGHAGDPDATI